MMPAGISNVREMPYRRKHRISPGPWAYGGQGFRIGQMALPALATPSELHREPGRKAEVRKLRRNSARDAQSKRIYVRAGWTDGNYWSGQVDNGGNNAIVVNDNGNTMTDNVDNDNPVVCLRP